MHKTLNPPSIFGSKIKGCSSFCGFKADRTSGIGRSSIKCSLIEAPVLWAGRVCIFYALLKAGLAGSPSNPLLSTTGS